jgi:uncharacterized membrane protein YgcG
MWVQNGKRIDSSTFSNSIVRTKFALYFGASIGVQDFRQLKMSMVREFIPPSLHLGGGDTISDMSSDHSRTIAHERYGLVAGDLRGLTEDTIWEYQAYNTEWFNFCGIGPQPPQQALRLLRQPTFRSTAEAVTLSPTPTDAIPDTPRFAQAEESLTRIVDKSVENSLSKAIPRAFRQMEHVILEELLPALVESTMDAILAKRKRSRSWLADGTDDMDMTSHPPSVAHPEVISIGSDNRDVISISSEEFIDDEASEDADYEETDRVDGSDDTKDNDQHSDGGRHGGGGGGSGNGGGGGTGSGGGGGTGSGGGGRGQTSGNRRNPPRATGGNISRSGPSHAQQALGHSTIPSSSVSLTVLQSIHEFECELNSGNDSSLPPTPSPLQESLEARAREGIRRALSDPAAVEKSPEQLQLLTTAIHGKKDGVFVIGTGGGKSLAWDVKALVEPEYATVVTVPYAPLLDQHLKTSLSRGIVAAKYTVSSEPPEDYQILYIQPETGKTTTFRE